MDKIRIDSLRSIRTSRLADTDVDRVIFDISPWREMYPALTDYRIEVTSPDGVVYFPAKVALEESELVWTITAEDTASAGDGLYQVVAAGANGERKTSAYATFAVRETMPGAASDILPDPAKPWVDKVIKAAQKVEDATVHPPIIGENGNWMLWDFEASAYVDSGKPSQGSGSGGGGIAKETDPTVPEWAKQPNPPTYTAQDVGARPADWLPTLNEIGAQPAGDYAMKSEIPAVPVQSVNGKTGAVELTAEDVGAASKESVDRLNEEKADKKDIPAPYTIPTASEDTLGGVKVGEGLQMDGDVLGVVPEPELEVIETIVCDGTYSNVSRTNLFLKRVVLYIHTQAATAATNVGVEIKNEKEMFGYLWLGNGVSTAERWMYVNAVSDGKQAAYIEGTSPSLTKHAGAMLNRTPSRYDGDTPITRVNVYASGGAMIPAGSTIEIWGVRANA